jgi:septal ring factor EnvC (AmiA/AmiB activator)
MKFKGVNMKNAMKWLGPSVLVLAFAAAVYAESNQTPGLDQREENRQKRIEQGEKSGALTSKEAERLKRGEAKLEKHEAKAKADGKVTPAERKRLNKEANRMGKRIHREKRDAQAVRP